MAFSAWLSDKREKIRDEWLAVNTPTLARRVIPFFHQVQTKLVWWSYQLIGIISIPKQDQYAADSQRRHYD